MKARHLRFTAAMCFGLLLGGAECTVEPTEDAGEGDDAGVQLDASLDQDATVQHDATAGHDTTVQHDANVGHDIAVEPDATVLTDAHVGTDATVAPDAHVGADATVAPDAHVGTDATVAPDAHVGTDAEARPDAHVETDATVTPDAHVETDATVRPDAEVMPDAEARPDTTVTVDADLDIDASSGDPNRDEFIMTLCAKQLECEAQWGKAYHNFEHCQVTMQSLFDCGYTFYIPTSAGVQLLIMKYGFNPTPAAECQSWMASLTCDQQMNDAPESCGDAILSDGFYAQEGDNCEAAFCAPGLTCGYDIDPSVCPVCVPEQAIGQPCAHDDGLDCVDGAYCDPVDGTCKARKANGEACLTDLECDEWCIDLVCHDPPGRGQPCNTDTAPDDCLGSLECVNNVCVDAVDLGGDCSQDEPCVGGTLCVDNVCQRYSLCQIDEGDICAMSCASGFYCDAATSRCVAAAGEGGACDFFSFTSCQHGLYCDYGTSTCMALLPNGEVCYSGNWCESGYCDPENYVCADAMQCTMP